MKQQIIQQFESFWNARDKREQKMLGTAAALIGFSLLYLIFLDPAITGKARLEKQIPELRQQVAEMSALGGEQARLAAGLTQIVEPVTKEIMEGSLAARGIKTQSLSVTDDIVRIQIQSVGYANLMDWLLESQRALRLTVEEARVLALAESGQVSVTLVLKQQRGGL